MDDLLLLCVYMVEPQYKGRSKRQPPHYCSLLHLVQGLSGIIHMLYRAFTSLIVIDYTVFGMSAAKIILISK